MEKERLESKSKTSHQSAQTLITEADAARYIGMSRSFLRMGRCYGTLRGHTPGPPYHKIGRRAIRYHIEDLDRWLDQHRHDPAGAL